MYTMFLIPECIALKMRVFQKTPHLTLLTSINEICLVDVEVKYALFLIKKTNGMEVHVQQYEGFRAQRFLAFVCVCALEGHRLPLAIHWLPLNTKQEQELHLGISSPSSNSFFLMKVGMLCTLRFLWLSGSMWAHMWSEVIITLIRHYKVSPLKKRMVRAIGQ